MVDDRTTTDLVQAAGDGDAAAWGELVQRYAGLVLGVCRRMRLSEADALDVSQTVWLRLVEHLRTLREPAALPGWLASTTRHECLKVLRRAPSVPVEDWQETQVRDAEEVDLLADLLAAERRSALRQAFAALPAGSRDLLALLLEDPPVPYQEIGRRLGLPVGSIGPTRARILARLRQEPGLRALAVDQPAPSPVPARGATLRGH